MINNSQTLKLLFCIHITKLEIPSEFFFHINQVFIIGRVILILIVVGEDRSLLICFKLWEFIFGYCMSDLQVFSPKNQAFIISRVILIILFVVGEGSKSFNLFRAVGVYFWALHE